MNAKLKFWLLAITLIVIALRSENAFAQSIRYDLGQRLRRFELEFEKNLSLTQRAKALKPMQQSVQNFFGGQLESAAQQLDEAWVSLLPDDKHSLAAWSASLQIVPDSSPLVSSDQFLFQVKEHYRPATDAPNEYQFVCETSLISGEHKQPPSETFFANSAKMLAVQTPRNGQYLVRVFVEADHVRLPVGEVFVTRCDNFESRISSLEKAAQSNRKTWQKSARATIRQQTKLLRRVVKKNDAETNIPVWFELLRIESLAKQADQMTWLKSNLEPWQATTENLPLEFRSFWLKIVGEGRKSLSLRASISNVDLASQTKIPCVVAVHGAGGSENMFFDAYGAGKVAKLCHERGWILIAPKISMAGSGLPLHEVIQQLAQQLPIDTDKVLIVGHSMGAGYAMSSVRSAAAVPSSTFSYRAVAPVGGGRPVQIGKADNAEKPRTQFFVSAGDSDFGRNGAEALHNSLERQKLDSRYKEYEKTEHMAVVQIALKDVFSFFDESLKK